MKNQLKDKKLNDNKLKIYIIDDCRTRRKAIIDYLKSVQRLLSGEDYDSNKDFEDCQQCFLNKGIGEIEFEEILPDEGTSDNSYYSFEKDAAWVLKIGGILKQKETRIFLIDLALSEAEVKTFSAGDGTFIASTAKDILVYIDENTCQKEYIIFESIARNLVEGINAILDIVPGENFKRTRYNTLLGDYFHSRCPVYEKVEAISEAFVKAMEEIE